MKKVISFINILALTVFAASVFAINHADTQYFPSLTEKFKGNIWVLDPDRQGPGFGLNGQALDATLAVAMISVYKEMPVYDYEYEYSRNSRFYSLDYFRKPSEAKVMRQVGTGSGFFLTADGYMLTNKHVVSDSNAEYRVSVSDTSTVQGRVVYRDPVHDLAILKVDGSGYSALKLGNSSTLNVGDKITGIGNAYGQITDSVSTGNVSALNRTVMVNNENGQMERIKGLIQTTARLYPGDSGGPLLNEKGEVVGINVASAVGRDISFSIPANTAKKVISDSGIDIRL
jgi:S1-C subfamily serine protease